MKDLVVSRIVYRCCEVARASDVLNGAITRVSLQATPGTRVIPTGFACPTERFIDRRLGGALRARQRRRDT